jgi:hypothetical protein
MPLWPTASQTRTPEGTGIIAQCRQYAPQSGGVDIGADTQAGAIRQRDLDPVVRLPWGRGLGPPHRRRRRIKELDRQEHRLRACSAPGKLPAPRVPSPVPQQAAADIMAAGDLGEAGARRLHLRHDPQLVLSPPAPPPLHPADNPHPGQPRP